MPYPASLWLTTGEIPANCMGAYHRLVHVAARFVRKEARRDDLLLAQAEFDARRRQDNHSTKVQNAENTKSPWKPVVKSTEDSSASVVAAIRQLSADVTKSLGLVSDGMQETFREVRSLRAVSSYNM